MQSNSGGLKRARSPKNQDRVPLPPIDGERMLQVYTHKSLRMPGAREGEDTDNERLSALGERVLEMAVLDALMGERPALSVDVLEVSAPRPRLLSTNIHPDTHQGHRRWRRRREMGRAVQHAHQIAVCSYCAGQSVIARGAPQRYECPLSVLTLKYRKFEQFFTHTSALSLSSRAYPPSSSGWRPCSVWRAIGKSSLFLRCLVLILKFLSRMHRLPRSHSCAAMHRHRLPPF